ncbi:methionine--tRNA ligase [Amycolatopsis samaneae]
MLARHRRRLGDRVRLQTGTDDNSLKNVLAAEAAGIPVREFVDRNAAAFIALREPLSLSTDDVLRTSHDHRHRTGVEKLWHACAEAGDFYRRYYEGLYCVGCEQFYGESELPGGRCPEHDVPPERVAEENWFFRLSRYTGQLRDLVESGRLRIEPAQRRNEVLGFLAGGLSDFSVSRSANRARGWGIPVPGDPGQVIYVWWDALGNYLTALGYGSGDAAHRRWWLDSDRRIHLVGKGVLRFHAVYWPAMLLSAGQPLPTDIVVHDYLTHEGRKISKSAGNTVDPAVLAGEYGTDAVRWWLLREVPRAGDADFTRDRLVARSDDELANGLGNLVKRVVAMVHRYRDGVVPTGGRAPGAERVDHACRVAAAEIAEALAEFDFRRATAAVQAIVDEANRFVNQAKPWELAKAERADPGELDAVLATLVRACRTVGEELAPFLPDAAGRVAQACAERDGRLPGARPLFRRLATVDTGTLAQSFD